MEQLNQATCDLHLNVDDLRGQQESEASWQHRRPFLQVHQGRFPSGRLNQLSYCFSNAIMYACEYSDSLMEELSALAVDVAAATALEQGDSTVRVSKNYLKDKIADKKNALFAEMRYMKKLHELRKNTSHCPSQDLQELVQQGGCILPVDSLINKEKHPKSSGQSVDVKGGQNLRKSSELSPLTERSRLAPLRQSSESSPLRQRVDLSPMKQSSQLSPLGRLNINTNYVKDNCFEELPSKQLKPETRKVPLIGTNRLLCSDARRLAAEASLECSLKKETNRSNVGPHNSSFFGSQAEMASNKQLKAVNFEPLTKCSNKDRIVQRAVNSGSHPPSGMENEMAPHTGSMLSAVNKNERNVHEIDLIKSENLGGRVYHCYRQGTTCLSSPSQYILGEINCDGEGSSSSFTGRWSKITNQGETTPVYELSHADTPIKDTNQGKTTQVSELSPGAILKVTNQGEITPIPETSLRTTLTKEGGHYGEKDVLVAVSVESRRPGQGKTTHLTDSTEKEIDRNFRPREIQLNTSGTEMSIKLKNDETIQNFSTYYGSTEINKVDISTSLGKPKVPSTEDEPKTETFIDQETTENSAICKNQRQRSGMYSSSKQKGEITQMTGKTEREENVNMRPVQKKDSTKYPVLDIGKKLQQSQHSLLKKVMKAHSKSRERQEFMSDNSELAKKQRPNNISRSRPQDQHKVCGKICDGVESVGHKPGALGTYPQISEEPQSKTRRRMEVPLTKEASSNSEGKIQNVQIGAAEEPVKNSQKIVSTALYMAPRKQLETSKAEQEDLKEKQEQRKDSTSVKEPRQSSAKHTRKDVSLYTDKLARKFSSKSSSEMAGRDYLKIDEGGQLFLVPNVHIQGQGRSSQQPSASGNHDVKRSQSHSKITVSTAPKMHGKRNVDLGFGKKMSVRELDIESRPKKKEFTPVGDDSSSRKAVSKRSGTLEDSMARSDLKSRQARANPEVKVERIW